MIITLVMLAGLASYGDSARILALTPFPTKSHYIVMEALFEELARRGHQVTVVTPFPANPPLPNKTDIDVSGDLPSMVNYFPLDDVRKNMPSAWAVTRFIDEVNRDTCKIIKDPRIRKLWDSKGQFDLVITELFGTDCFTYFAYKLKVPLMSMTTSVLMPWASERLGLPDNPSFIPTYLSDTSPEMTLYERIYNTGILWYGKFYHQWIYPKQHQNFFEKVLGESLPPLHEVVANTSLVLVNSYHALTQSRPFPPNVIEVGGVHLKPRQPLPKDLQKMLDEAKQGVILMSFGSLFRSSSLPKSVITSFMKVFTKIPQTVFFKFEDDLPEAPQNVIVRKWLPLRDMMEHKNVIAVIQHGGLASTIEAVYFNKPMLGIPCFGDQFINVHKLVEKGAGLELSLDTLNEQNIQQALSEVLNNPKYKEGMARLSLQYRDRPMSGIESPVFLTDYLLRHKGAPHLRPVYKEGMARLSLQYRDRPMSGMESAVFWTEYVLRHKGSLHLRPVSVKLPLYQYLLLDVAAVLVLSTLASLCIVILFLRVAYKRVKTTQNKSKQKRS